MPNKKSLCLWLCDLILYPGQRISEPGYYYWMLFYIERLEKEYIANMSINWLYSSMWLYQHQNSKYWVIIISVQWYIYPQDTMGDPLCLNDLF